METTTFPRRQRQRDPAEKRMDGDHRSSKKPVLLPIYIPYHTCDDPPVGADAETMSTALSFLYHRDDLSTTRKNSNNTTTAAAAG
eukprot:scaffold1475_cov167-Amphora_coffeaeformis.AAC.8